MGCIVLRSISCSFIVIMAASVEVFQFFSKMSSNHANLPIWIGWIAPFNHCCETRLFCSAMRCLCYPRPHIYCSTPNQCSTTAWDVLHYLVESMALLFICYLFGNRRTPCSSLKVAKIAERQIFSRMQTDTDEKTIVEVKSVSPTSLST